MASTKKNGNRSDSIPRKLLLRRLPAFGALDCLFPMQSRQFVPDIVYRRLPYRRNTDYLPVIVPPASDAQIPRWQDAMGQRSRAVDGFEETQIPG